MMKISLYPTFPACLQQPVTTNALDDGWGQPIPAGLSYPHPRLWSSDCVQIMKMTFKCYISENDENTLKFRHFLHVYNNQSLEMPWMTGGGNLFQLVYLTPTHDFRAVIGY